MRTAKNDWSDCVDRAILYDWNAMKTDQRRGSCSLVGLKCYDQTAWIVQSCMTEMLWRLIRLRRSCSLVGLKCYEDWSDCMDRAILYDWNAMKTDQTAWAILYDWTAMKIDQTAWIVQSCMTKMLWRLIRLHGQSCMTEMLWRLIRLRGSCSLVGLKCYEDWSDCLDRAILYDWNAMKTDQTAWAILYDWNAMKIDQIAWIVQSCRTEMLWRLIRLRGRAVL